MIFNAAILFVSAIVGGLSIYAFGSKKINIKITEDGLKLGLVKARIKSSSDHHKK